MSVAAAQTQVDRRRCAIYTRKSTDEGLDQDFNTLDAQREAGEAYIASQRHQGWESLLDRYDDGGFTGANVERPALQRLMADIEEGKIDAVVVYKVDRLSRSLLDFARLVEVFDRHGVAFVSVTQQFDTASSMGRLILNVLLSFAQFEREMIAERTRDKMAAARKKGKWLGGTPPLGYDVTNGRLVINEEETQQVRELFRTYLAERSLIATADILNARGWRTKSWTTKKGRVREGRKWDKGSVHRVLTNVTYIGKVSHKGDIYEGEQDAVIDAEIFARVRELLDDNAADRGASTRNRQGFLLRSLLRCAACGSAMTTSFSKGRSSQYRYYVCTKVNRSGRKACTVKSIPADAVEDYVIKQLRQIAGEPEVIGRITEQLTREHAEKLPALEKERERLRDEHRRRREEAAGAIRALAGEGETSRLAAEHLAELDQRAVEIERRLTTIREEMVAISRQRVDVTDVRRVLSLFDQMWDLLGIMEQARILRLLLERVDYDGVKGEMALSFFDVGVARLAREIADADEQPAVEAAS